MRGEISGESHMQKEMPLPRLVLTENDQNGRSRIVSDGPPKAVRTVEDRPGYRVSNLWVTAGSPAPVDDPDRTAEIKGLMPPKGGTMIRLIDYPPEPADPVERKKMFDAMFAKLFPDGAHRDANPPHPGMHKTLTVDYALVLSGEIYAVMDENEVLLKAGDVLIQRGTNHGWSNRSNDFCRIAFVLIDGR
jgi:mannose-6-phosphate isomerase-like protein (cupin superfamily)